MVYLRQTKTGDAQVVKNNVASWKFPPKKITTPNP